MSLLAHKKDKYGQAIMPGNVCVYDGRFVVFKRHSWGGASSKGLYGVFIDNGKEVSVRYSSVLFVFEPSSKRHSEAPVLRKLLKEYYEGK